MTDGEKIAAARYIAWTEIVKSLDALIVCMCVGFVATMMPVVIALWRWAL